MSTTGRARRPWKACRFDPAGVPAIIEERAEELFPERRKDRFPLVSSPFTASPVSSGKIFSNGGLELDTEMRVLRRTTTISTLPNVVARTAELKLDVSPGLFAGGLRRGKHQS